MRICEKSVNDKASIFLYRSNAKAPAIVGIARKNENSAAALFSTLSSNAPVIVEPERDTPGINAKTWQNPILKQSVGENCSMLLCCG